MTRTASPRHLARQIALQALYAWQLAGGTAADALEHAVTLEGWDRCNRELAEAIIRGVIERAAVLEALLTPCLTQRGYGELSPVERAVLSIGAFELAEHPSTPVKVVLNEAVELGKSFGGTDGHRFVNGVLEKLAGRLRAGELARARQTA